MVGSRKALKIFLFILALVAVSAVWNIYFIGSFILCSLRGCSDIAFHTTLLPVILIYAPAELWNNIGLAKVLPSEINNLLWMIYAFFLIPLTIFFPIYKLLSKFRLIRIKVKKANKK